MRQLNSLRWFLTSLLAGGTLLLGGCGDMVRESIKDGIFTYVTGSVSSTFDSALFGDFITNIFTGGFTPGTSGSSGTSG